MGFSQIERILKLTLNFMTLEVNQFTDRHCRHSVIRLNLS